MKIIELWCLRMLVCHGGHRKFIEKNGFSSDLLLTALGLDEYIDAEDVNRAECMATLRERLEYAEAQGYGLPATVASNISKLREKILLSDVEAMLLGFTVLLHSEQVLEDCADTLGQLDRNKLTRALATTLGYTQQEINAVLAVKGQLALSGLVKVDPTWSRDMKQKLDLMSGLTDSLLSPQIDPKTLFANCYSEGLPPRLAEDDFLHVSEEYALIRNYLDQALEFGSDGVNILIYGKPGSGKSEMVRTLAASMRTKLYEISMEDRDGDALTGNARFSAYQLSQQILGRDERTLILFDEIEDVIPDRERNGGSRPLDNRKAWINRLLETNPVPAIWLSNSVYHIDPAYLRRFDFVLEMPEPDRVGRKRILTRYLEGVSVRDGWINSVSEHHHLMPAHIEKAAKVASMLPGSDQLANELRNEQEMERVLNGMMQVLRKPKIKPGRAPKMSTGYRLEYLNADIDLDRLLEGLGRTGRGNVCFYGPPGTGKSALADHIAKVLDRPLLAKKASDILSMWVGGTEENIAKMFRQASKEGAVLLLDEADSLLRDRRGANRSWEVTQVNELLVQMEQFDGLFICSTNLMDDLDQASLRRFAIKAKFDYLRPEQALMMLQNECVDVPDEGQAQAIQALKTLAPGDFSAVKKRLDILGLEASPEVMINGLKEEVAVKGPSTSASRIGFLN
ncbi:AAA family ATPase [Mariprofundus erugo]|uniref:AAA family ATPase n=1 Tax=Mariprofundus erugo TaxID=2528639 RepID=UPI0013870857|nr:ATP-binding protein [Mariprofundus erugo]